MQTKTNPTEGASPEVDLWGDQFARLEEQLSQSSAPGHAVLRRRLAALERKKRTLKRRLREAAHGSTATDWDDVRGSLEQAVVDFKSLSADTAEELRGAKS